MLGTSCALNPSTTSYLLSPLPTGVPSIAHTPPPAFPFTVTQPHIPPHNNQVHKQTTPTHDISPHSLCTRAPTSTFLTQAQERINKIMAASDAINSKLLGALMPPTQDSALAPERTFEQQTAIIRANILLNRPDAVLTPPTRWGMALHVSAEA